jgi:hypothetical protein
MPTTRICIVVDVPADRLWAKLSEYGTWGDWISQLSESNVEGYDGLAEVPIGAVRAVGPRGVPRTRERLVSSDEIARVVSYQVEKEPKWRFPARYYRGTAKIISLTDRDGSVIEWSGTYDCDAKDDESMQELLTGLYHSFVAGLVQAAASSNA